MPKIENTKVYGLESVFRSAKFPLSVETDKLNNELTEGIEKILSAKSGTGHDNALKGIIVKFDLTIAEKAWVQAERYHWFDIESSCSLMHRAAKMQIRSCCNKYVSDAVLAEVERIKQDYLANRTDENYLKLLYNIPMGFELKAAMVTNYQQLKTIYHQRRTHKLPDWWMICDWIETLPYSYLITGKEQNEPDK